MNRRCVCGDPDDPANSSICEPACYGEPIVRDGTITTGRRWPENHAADPFSLDARRQGWDCCTTHGLPYDVVAAASLLAAKHHLADRIRIGADSRWFDHWTAAPEAATPADVYEYIFPDRTPTPAFERIALRAIDRSYYHVLV